MHIRFQVVSYTFDLKSFHTHSIYGRFIHINFTVVSYAFHVRSFHRMQRRGMKRREWEDAGWLTCRMPTPQRYLENVAHLRKPRPDSGLGFQVKPQGGLVVPLKVALPLLRWPRVAETLATPAGVQNKYINKWKRRAGVQHDPRFKPYHNFHALKDHTLAGPLWEGCRESRRCSRDTYPESYIIKYTSIRR